MVCESCGEKPKNESCDFTRAVVEIDNPEKLILLRKVVVPASLGDETTFPPKIGKYFNVILHYEINKHTYIYSSDGIPTLLETEVPKEVLDRISTLEIDLAAETKNREDADTALDNRLTTVEGIASTALQPAAINKVVMTDIALDANTSTTTVQINGAKENLLTGAQTTKNLPLPVASHDEAGIMNSATFDAVTENTSNINALMNGAVAITGLPASPTQAQLTTAWENETGLSELMNRAGIYDVTNNKVWTYYTNDSTWHAATNTTQVTINTFTNSAEGTIKGSTNVGQVFAENDGTGSVNGWDTLSNNVSTNAGNITSLQTNKQDKLTAGANITIDANNVISATGGGVSYTAGDGIKIENNIISADIYPADFFTAGDTVTGTGTDIAINNTLATKIQDVQLNGDTTQQTYTGKNLFNFNNGTLAWGNAAYQTHTNDANSCTMTATGTGGAQYGYVKFGPLDPTKTYTLSGIAKKLVAGSDGNPNLMLAYGISDDGVNYTWKGTKWYQNNPVVGTEYDMRGSFTGNAYYMFYLYNNSDTPVTIGESSTYYNLQLELGSTATTYEPYVGGTASPNPDYPQDVQVVTGEQTVNVHGKNLWGGSLELGGIDIHTGVNSSAADRVRTVGYISVQPNTVYTISGVLASRYAIFYNSSKTYLGYVLVDARNTKGTFTTPANTAYIRWYIIQTDTNVDEQLELGSTATSYEPYQSQDYTVNLGSLELAKIGDYQDKIYRSGEDWYVHKEIGKVVFDGTETWSTPRNDSYSIAKTEISSLNLPSGTLNLFVNTFTIVATAGELAIGKATVGGSYINFDYDGTNTNMVTFKTWLSNNQTTLYAPLTTATDTQITDASLIAQLDALANAMAIDANTYIEVAATGTNLPSPLTVTAYRKSLAGVMSLINNLPIPKFTLTTTDPGEGADLAANNFIGVYE